VSGKSHVVPGDIIRWTTSNLYQENVTISSDEKMKNRGGIT
jgi:hypothetical protein